MTPATLARDDCARSQDVRSFTWHVADDIPDRLLGDAPRLRQILQNLVGNALKLTTKGSVDVRTKRSGAAADDRTTTFRFEVDDTGIGMAPEQSHGSSMRSRRPTTASRSATAKPAWACRSRNACRN